MGERENELTPDQECIDFLTNHSYIKNFSPVSILKDHQFRIPIEQFICYCVGMIDSERTVQCIRIHQKIPSEKITSMQIQWFYPNHPEKGSILFWVNSGVCLKRQFFLYQDQLNFFRSTFIYYPEMQKYFRLSTFTNYISIPEVNPLGEPIYNSPFKCYRYNKQLTNHPGKIHEKKKREFRKAMVNTLKKHNIDSFMEIYYPHLFKEISAILL